MSRKMLNLLQLPITPKINSTKNLPLKSFQGEVFTYRIQFLFSLRSPMRLVTLFFNFQQIKHESIFQRSFFYPLETPGGTTMPIIHIDMKKQRIVVGF